MEYLFDPEGNKADIYACYDRILQLGIKHLYMDTKDITELKKSRLRRSENNDKAKKDLFSFNASTQKQEERDQKQFRKELEQAYEREKSKVSIHQVSINVF